MTRVLFVCTGNSCRSQIAEGWLRSMSPPGLEVESAGTHPIDLHPEAVRTMAEVGIDISSQHSKPLTGEMLERADVVVTVCSHADARCPALPPGKRKFAWDIPDPTGEASFAAVRDDLRRRIEGLLGEIEE